MVYYNIDIYRASINITLGLMESYTTSTSIALYIESVGLYYIFVYFSDIFFMVSAAFSASSVHKAE